MSSAAQVHIDSTAHTIGSTAPALHKTRCGQVGMRDAVASLPYGVLNDWGCEFVRICILSQNALSGCTIPTLHMPACAGDALSLLFMFVLHARAITNHCPREESKENSRRCCCEGPDPDPCHLIPRARAMIVTRTLQQVQRCWIRTRSTKSEPT